MISIINIIIETICLIMALVHLKNNNVLFSKITKGYLAIVVITETIGFSMSKGYHLNNAWLYNIFIIFEAAYISYGLYVALKSFTKKAALICVIPMIAFLGIYLFEIYHHGFLKFNSLSVNIYSIIFVIISLLYFHLLVKQKNPIILKINPQFWWVTAVLFYYFGSTVYNLFVHLLYQQFPKTYIILAYTMLGLNLLLYSIWIYSFICNSRQQKLLSSSH